MNLKMQAECDLAYINGEPKEEREKELSEFFYGLLKPQVFYGTKGKEATYFREFEQTCNVMRQNGVPEPKGLKAREYFQYLADLTKQSQKNKTPHGRR